MYASASSVSENLTYIVNPSYPSNYVPSSTPTTLTYTINKCSVDICRYDPCHLITILTILYPTGSDWTMISLF